MTVDNFSGLVTSSRTVRLLLRDLGQECSRRPGHGEGGHSPALGAQALSAESHFSALRRGWGSKVPKERCLASQSLALNRSFGKKAQRLRLVQGFLYVLGSGELGCPGSQAQPCPSHRSSPRTGGPWSAVVNAPGLKPQLGT